MDVSRSLEQRQHAGDLDRRLRQRLQPNVNINERLPNDDPYEEDKKARRLWPAHPRSRAANHATKRHFRYRRCAIPGRDTHAALMALRENGESDPYDGVMIMLASPVDGGPTLPTIAWQAQLFSKQQKTLPHRHNSTTFYFAFEGEGAVVIEGERLEYHQRAISSPCRHGPGTTTKTRHDDDTILFSIDDWPAMKKLGFYMKEEAKGF